MSWYNSSWTKRKPITLTGGASGAQTDYQVKVTVTYDSDMKSDFSDLRFTKADGTTLLDAWMESHTTSTSAIIWVETDTPANTVEADIYMYYGNSGVSSDWDVGTTFAFGDDLESYADTAAMLAVWDTVYGSPTLETTTVYEGSKGVNITSLSWMSRNSALTDNCELVVWGRYTATTDDYGLWIRNSGGGNVVHIEGGYPTSGNWGYKIDSGSDVNTGMGQASINAWHKMTLRLSGGKVSFWEDSTLIMDEISYSGTPYDIVLGRDSSYHDLIYIYKYVTNPATYVFGSEQSETGWTNKIIGITSPGKVIGVANSAIAKIMGV